ncbi:MAG: M23 family metallopeptidase [Chloroflexota bacterium]|nr:M23 family metallopeptidase [Chloroflexota bacterium]
MFIVLAALVMAIGACQERPAEPPHQEGATEEVGQKVEGDAVPTATVLPVPPAATQSIVRPSPSPSPSPAPAPVVAARPKATPLPAAADESREVLAQWRNWKQRTGLSLPFAGVAYVSQGWNGREPTHYGKWRYALDFIILDREGRSRRGDGSRVEDYYIWGAQVLAPAAGKVVAVEEDVADNPPNQPNDKERWGNYVVLDHGNGEFSEMSHFQWASIVVEVGQTVERGQVLGLVGNSGYAYEPHIHFQLQDSPLIAATTLPARFARFYELLRGRVYLRTDRVPFDGNYVTNQAPASPPAPGPP